MASLLVLCLTLIVTPTALGVDNIDSVGVAPADTAKEAGHTDWGSELAALQAQLMGRMQGLRSISRARMTTTSLPELAVTTSERTLLAKIEDLQREMCADPGRHSNPLCAPFLANGESEAQTVPETTTALPTRWLPGTVQRQTASSEWIASLLDLQTKLEADAKRLRHAKMQKQVTRRGLRMTVASAKLALIQRKLKAIAEQRVEWERDMSSRASALMKELCAQPHRQNYAACKALDVPESTTTRPLVVAELPVQSWGQAVDRSVPEPIVIHCGKVCRTASAAEVPVQPWGQAVEKSAGTAQQDVPWEDSSNHAKIDPAFLIKVGKPLLLLIVLLAAWYYTSRRKMAPPQPTAPLLNC